VRSVSARLGSCLYFKRSRQKASGFVCEQHLGQTVADFSAMKRCAKPFWDHRDRDGGLSGYLHVAHRTKLKERMARRLGEVSIRRSGWTAWLGVFFTVLTISREGMETSLMLLQVPQSASVIRGPARIDRCRRVAGPGDSSTPD